MALGVMIQSNPNINISILLIPACLGVGANVNQVLFDSYYRNNNLGVFSARAEGEGY